MTVLNSHQALVISLCEWIEDHLGCGIALPELALISGFSVWYMQSVFRATTGIAIGRYIRERKLTEAVYRLRETDLRVLDIAVEFGFNSQSQFTTLFKKYYGITPQACRQNPHLKLRLTPPLLLAAANVA
ncbi:AraC family transcriptional regulator [Enterobacteriaceae bacterium H20N1]|uniref:AraC family transcriptional regulator n=1 Tax=Dryocola boscaweniae TaxID=2925397 RepID=A0A9X2W714_9ENTR|nr:AraC family transcriptional regulator [Dryocola boscaweniae]MCT4702161.1 AraC family transcriptional regulator [Dryocola boscaweniae]MCT4714451.1 AraC family transcriptional regulator [Dryocola boscaweniae]MCT4719395.1 AraC family transcriptional regulator [Dryocola boscaweniae]